MPNSQTGESSAKEYNPASGSMNLGLAQMDPVSFPAWTHWSHVNWSGNISSDLESSWGRLKFWTNHLFFWWQISVKTWMGDSHIPNWVVSCRGVLNTEHARMSARSVHILGCSKSSIPELLQYEHVRACSVPEPCYSWAQDPKKPHPNIPKLGQKYFVMLYKIWIFYTKLKQCGNW